MPSLSSSIRIGTKSSRDTQDYRYELVYLGGMGLRSTSVWAASAGLADLSNIALLERLRNGGVWMEHLVGKLLGTGTQPSAGSRRIRLADGTTVPKVGKEVRENSHGAARHAWRTKKAEARVAP